MGEPRLLRAFREEIVNRAYCHPTLFLLALILSSPGCSINLGGTHEPLLPSWTGLQDSKPTQKDDGAPPQFAGGARFLIGWRGLDEDFLEPVEDQFAIGAEFNVGPADPDS